MSEPNKHVRAAYAELEASEHPTFLHDLIRDLLGEIEVLRARVDVLTSHTIATSSRSSKLATLHRNQYRAGTSDKRETKSDGE